MFDLEFITVSSFDEKYILKIPYGTYLSRLEKDCVLLECKNMCTDDKPIPIHLIETEEDLYLFGIYFYKFDPDYEDYTIDDLIKLLKITDYLNMSDYKEFIGVKIVEKITKDYIVEHGLERIEEIDNITNGRLRDLLTHYYHTLPNHVIIKCLPNVTIIDNN